MEEFLVPQGISFLKLKLKKKNGQYIYNRKQITKICLLNGFNHNDLKRIQITEAMLIIFLYFNHLENGGERHPIAEELAEYVNNYVGFYKKPSYKPLKYKTSYRDTNNDLIKYHSDGHSHIQQMSPEKYQVLGQILTIILLLEFKLDNLLIKFDSKIKDKTLGSKIKVFKDFLFIFETADEEDKQDYFEIIPPLEELNKFRNKIAHKLIDISFKISDLPLIKNYMLENSRDIEEVTANAADETVKFIAYITLFSLKASELLAHLRIQIV